MDSITREVGASETAFQPLNNGELIVINYTFRMKTHHAHCTHHLRSKVKVGIALGSQGMQRVPRVMHLKPYIRKTSPENLLTQLNHGAHVLWN